MAKREQPGVVVWVAVPVDEPDRVGSGYWLSMTRLGLEAELNRDCGINTWTRSQWVARRVQIVVPKRPRPAKKAAKKSPNPAKRRSKK